MHYLLNNVFTEAEHSLCNTYVLRELNGVLDREREGAKSEWAAKLKFLLKEANVSVNPIEKARLTIKAQKDYRQEYKKIVKEGLVFHPHQPKPKTQKRGAAKQTKTRNLLLRLQKRRDNYLLFLKEPTASFTNNQAEQDLRMLKVKTKISGCFKSMTASQQFRLLDRILVRLPNRDLI
jgi:transposase